MAIRNILKSTAQGILGKNLRRVAGGFANLIGGPNRTDSADFNNRTKQATNMLSFPIDIGEDASAGNHGHYMMFFINEQTNSTLKFDNIRDDIGKLTGQDNLFKEAKKRGFGILEKVVDSVTGKIFEKTTDPSEAYMSYFFKPDGTSTEAASKIINNRLATGDINNGIVNTRQNKEQTISIERRPTRRLDSVITMFMPADVKVSYKANYTDTSIGSLTQAASQIIGEYVNQGSVSGDTIQKNAGDVFKAVGIDGIINLLSNVPSLGGAREALEMGMGAIVADRMEMAFKGIDKRKFSYTFKMLPRSEKEANEVKRIIDMFKFHMLPEMLDRNTRGRLMSYPSTFDIKYMYMGNDNTYLNKVSECYLESMDVDYGGDRYKTHEGNANGAPPVETTITLQFGEIELITRERAEQGF